jgi:tetratricopeptide (TPR) repeat protein
MAAIFGGKKEKKTKSVLTIEGILDDADSHLKNGETDKAASEYRRAHRYLYREENLSGSPEEFSDLFTRTGHGLFETGEPDRAVECFDKSTQLNPKNTDAWMSRGIVHLRTETMLNFAAMCFEEVLKIDPENIEALENQAEAYLRGNKKSDAVGVYKKLIEISPDNEEYGRKVDELEPRTIDSITEELKKTPKDVNLWRIKAELLEKEGETAKAIEAYLRVGYLGKEPDVYEKVLELNPRNKTALDKLLELKPDDVGLLEKKVEMLESEGQTDECQKLYAKLSELDPDNEKYKEKLAAAEPDEMAAIEDILTSDPDNVDALAKKASILEERNEDGAEEIYAKLVELAPDKPEYCAGALKYRPDDIGLLNKKGDLHFEKDEYEEALACYAKIADRSPHNAEALHNKGAVLFKLQKFDESVAVFDQILEIDGNDVAAYLTKGAALFKSGKIDEAVDALNNVVKRDPDEAAAWYYKA